MAKQIVNEMATNLSLNTESATAALKELTSVVKDSSTEARILENQYKASGDAVSASKAKYEGLQQTLEAQKSKIEALKAGLENVNTSTDKGRELQNYLNTELAKAERQYASYSGQLEKATQSYKYQESGLAKLNDELKHSNSLTEARVQKLEAEGRTEEANQVKLNNLKNTQENYTKQLEIQKAELNKLSESGDKSSNAYKRQELRVAQMGAKLSETTRDIKNFNRTDIKPETQGLTTVKNKLESLDRSLEGTRSRFKSIFMGNLIAGGVISGLNSVKSHITGVVKAGIDYDKEIQNMKIGFDNFTSGNREVSTKLMANFKGVREESGYAADTVALLTKKTYGLTQNTDGAKKLSDSFVNLGRATGMSDTKLTGLITKFSQANASGEITAGSITKLNKQLPGFSDTLAQTMNVSKDKLAELASSGKLSMQDLAKAIETMSDAKPKGLDNYYKTFDGFASHFEERYKSLSGKITEGFFNESNTMLSGLSKSLDGAQVDKSFDRIGESANKSVNVIVKAFSSSFKDTKSNPVADMANYTADSIEKLGNFVAKHASDIKSFFEMTKNLGSAGFGVIGTTLKIALPLLEQLGHFAAEHPKTFQVLAASVVGFDLALKGVLGTAAQFGKIKSAFKDISGLIIKPKVDGEPAKRELGIIGKLGKGIGKAFSWTAELGSKAFNKSWETIKIAGTTAKKWGKSAFSWSASLAKTAFTKSLSALKTVSSATGKLISKSLQFTASIATKGATLAMNGLVKTARVTGNGIKLAFNFLKANPLILLVSSITAVIVAFTELYKHNKKFRNFVNDLVKSAQNFFKGVTGWFSNTWNDITKSWNGFSKSISKSWDSFLNNLSRDWTNTWNGISGFFVNIWNGMKKFGHDAVWSLKNTFDDVLGRIGGAFSNTWTGIKSGFSDMWQGMKDLARDGINAVIKIPNAGISGINGLIHDFGGPESAIGKIPEVKKFANGTGAIDKLTHAILNDGNDSPETGNKETIIHPNGKMEIVQGQNTERLLLPGTEVLNARETAMLMGLQGITHFANGTGFWSKLIHGAGSFVGNIAGKAWDGLKNGVEKFTKMFEYITGAVKDPEGTLSKVMDLKNSGISNFADGIATGAFKKIKSTAKDWWSTLWNMANDASSAGADGGMKGDDYKYKSRAADSMPPDEWGYYIKECVSFVASRLANMGVNPSLFSHLGNGRDWVNAPVPHSKTPKVGDVAVYGAGSEFGNHVAMVTGVQGDKISGEEYNWNGDHAYHTYHGRSASGATTFLDFGKSVDAKAKEIATNSPLAKLIKKQTGGMMDWIKKFIAPLNDSSTGKDGNVQSWADDVKKALSKLGLSTSDSMVQRVLRQINTESGGNPKAIGGTDGLADGRATGLMQVKPTTFSAYALAGHNNIMNGYDNLLAGLNYAKHRYGDSLSFLGNGHGYANGGLITRHQFAEIGENNQPEMIIPLDAMKSSRGFELLGKTAVAMAARDGQNNASVTTDNSKLESKLDNVITLLSQLVQGQGNQLVQAVFSKDELYRKQANDVNLRDYQSLNRG